MNPSELTVEELIHYGSMIDDPWVKALIVVAEDRHEDLIEEFEQKISALESDVSYHENEEEEAHTEKARWKTKYEALRYNLNYDEQLRTIVQLKERVMELKDYIHDERVKMELLRSNYDELQNSYYELKEKYNTWTALSAEYK